MGLFLEDISIVEASFLKVLKTHYSLQIHRSHLCLFGLLHIFRILETMLRQAQRRANHHLAGRAWRRP